MNKRKNCAEHLLNHAQPMLRPKERILLAETSDDPAVGAVLMARAKIALDFGKKRGSFQLAAMVEGWDLERIKREMY